MTVRVKICGVTRVADAIRAADLGADFIGINFYPPSPRHVELEQAVEICRAVALDGRARLVGVFVNAIRDYISERIERLRLDLVQFHGDEDDAALAGWPVPVIRAIRIKDDAPSRTAVEQMAAAYILIGRFDPKLYGGTGRSLNLKKIAGFDLGRVFISGGLTPPTVAAAAALGPYAVDVASGVESAPGIKDEKKMRSFIANAKSSG